MFFLNFLHSIACERELNFSSFLARNSKSRKLSSIIMIQGSCKHSENFLVKHSKLDYSEDRTMQELAIFYKLENHSRLITSFSTTFKLKHNKKNFLTWISIQHCHITWFWMYTTWYQYLWDFSEEINNIKVLVTFSW